MFFISNNNVVAPRILVPGAAVPLPPPPPPPPPPQLRPCGGKHMDPVKNMSLYHCMTVFLLVAICYFVYNKPKVKFIHSDNRMEHYRI